jgi:hypothetical protein
MSTVLDARVGISEAILVGLAVESGPAESLESRSVEVAPKYLDLLRETREHFEKLNLAGVSERKLFYFTSGLLQMQDLTEELSATLRQMIDSGRAELAGQRPGVETYLHRLDGELDWLEEKIETFSLALDRDFVSEMNRRIETAPVSSSNTADWKRDLASLCD